LNVTPSSIKTIGKKRSSKLEFAPNPVDHSFILNEPQATSVEIFSLLGKSVMKQSLNGEKNVDVSLLKSGMYVLKASFPDKIASVSMIKK
jgi:hypothetical protein